MFFRRSIKKSLKNLVSNMRRGGHSIGEEVNCTFGMRPKDQYGFAACVTTNSASHGDLNGVYHFYRSRPYSEFLDMLCALTQEVAEAKRAFPQLQFIRALEFASVEMKQVYLSPSEQYIDLDSWLYAALNWDWKHHGEYLQERFEGGTWAANERLVVEQLDLITNTISSVRAAHQVQAKRITQEARGEESPSVKLQKKGLWQEILEDEPSRLRHQEARKRLPRFVDAASLKRTPNGS